MFIIQLKIRYSYGWHNIFWRTSWRERQEIQSIATLESQEALQFHESSRAFMGGMEPPNLLGG